MPAGRSSQRPDHDRVDFHSFGLDPIRSPPYAILSTIFANRNNHSASGGHASSSRNWAIPGLNNAPLRPKWCISVNIIFLTTIQRMCSASLIWRNHRRPSSESPANPSGLNADPACLLFAMSARIYEWCVAPPYSNHTVIY